MVAAITEREIVFMAIQQGSLSWLLASAPRRAPFRRGIDATLAPQIADQSGSAGGASQGLFVT
jgi:hypothetical protein